MQTSKMTGLLLVAAWGLLAAASQPAGTTSEARVAAKFQKTTAELNRIQVSQPAEVKKVAAAHVIDDGLVEEALRLIQAEVARRDKEIAARRKEYLPKTEDSRPTQVDNELLPLLAAIPGPIPDLPMAKQQMPRNQQYTVFSKYVEKLKRQQERLQAAARDEIPAELKDSKLQKEAADKAAAKARQDVNNNPIIQQMGGIENLKNMSPAQREALAKQMVEQVKANPAAFTSGQADPRQQFTQKMMQDAEYAARYNSLNTDQKKVEYDRFLAENGFTNKTYGSDATGCLPGANEAATIIAIEKRLQSIRQHESDLSATVAGLQTTIDGHFAELYEQIGRQYKAIVAALPEVEHGEAGKSKNTYPVDITYQILLYPVHVKNALSNKDGWKRYTDILKITIAEYSQLFSDYWGKDKTTDRLMAERGLVPSGVAAGLCGQLIHLTESAASQSNQNAAWQRAYDQTVLHIND